MIQWGLRFAETHYFTYDQMIIGSTIPSPNHSYCKGPNFQSKIIIFWSSSDGRIQYKEKIRRSQLLKKNQFWSKRKKPILNNYFVIPANIQSTFNRTKKIIFKRLKSNQLIIHWGIDKSCKIIKNISKCALFEEINIYLQWRNCNIKLKSSISDFWKFKDTKLKAK